MAFEAGARRVDPACQQRAPQQRVGHARTAKTQQVAKRRGRAHQVERIGAEVGDEVDIRRPRLRRQGTARARLRQFEGQQVAHDTLQGRIVAATTAHVREDVIVSISTK